MNMCGICGIAKNNIEFADNRVADAMTVAMIARGPDDQGRYCDKKIILGMRRLKIIDPDGGVQPMFNKDRTVVLVCNGEIYNYLELMEELKTLGHSFRTNSDIETIIHAYDEWGIGCIDKFRGMFAIALYDIKKSKLFLIRDRMGEKPLYFFRFNQDFYFSSDLNSFLLAGLPIRINSNALAQYLRWQYVMEPETIYSGVSKLRAGHFLAFDLTSHEYSITRYWNLEKADIDPDSPEKTIRQLTEEIMSMIIRSDVPVGVSLSGGLDSTVVATLASRNLRGDITALCVGYPGEPVNDEREKARLVARNLGIKLHEIELGTRQFIAGLPEMAKAMDEPIGDIAAFGYFQVMRRAREIGIPVILNGIGADEIFWGYQWLNDAVRKTKKITWKLASRINKKHVFSSVNNHFSKKEKLKTFFSEDFSGFFGKEIFKGNEQQPSVNELFKDVFDYWLYPNCTALGDKMSMANSIELRSPFLDYKLVELVFAINAKYPDDYKLPYKQRFKTAMRDLLPDELIDKPKRGFEPPVREWQTETAKKFIHTLYDGILVKNGILDKKSLAAGLRDMGAMTISFIYRAILFELWAAEKNVRI